MAGNQNLDEMGGFRRAMPFTFGCFIVGGLALAGVPPFSGFFSKDDILAYVAARDDWHVVLAVLGFVGSLMTAIYTFRMIFRDVLGEPVEPARVLATTRPPLPRARATPQPGHGRGRGHRRRLPRRPTTTSPSTRAR